MTKLLNEVQAHLEAILIESDSTRLDTNQLVHLGKAMGLVEFLINKDSIVKGLEEETFSNCCGVPMDEDESFCPDCKENCVPTKNHEN